MNAAQTEIAELIAQLPAEERRELVEHLYDTNLFGDNFSDRLSPELKSRLAESMVEAERGEVIPSEGVFAELANKYGFSRG